MEYFLERILTWYNKNRDTMLNFDSILVKTAVRSATFYSQSDSENKQNPNDV